VVGIETGYGLEERGLGVRVPLGLRILFSLRVFQTGTEVHPLGSGVLSPGVKWPGREDDHSPPSSAEFKTMWIYTSTPPYAFMA
jgi:hypothetical protein